MPVRIRSTASVRFRVPTVKIVSSPAEGIRAKSKPEVSLYRLCLSRHYALSFVAVERYRYIILAPCRRHRDVAVSVRRNRDGRTAGGRRCSSITCESPLCYLVPGHGRRRYGLRLRRPRHAVRKPGAARAARARRHSNRIQVGSLRPVRIERLCGRYRNRRRRRHLASAGSVRKPSRERIGILAGRGARRRRQTAVCLTVRDGFRRRAYGTAVRIKRHGIRISRPLRPERPSGRDGDVSRDLNAVWEMSPCCAVIPVLKSISCCCRGRNSRIRQPVLDFDRRRQLTARERRRYAWPCRRIPVRV